MCWSHSDFYFRGGSINGYKWGFPKNGGLIMENPFINGWDLGYPYFRKPPFLVTFFYLGVPHGNQQPMGNQPNFTGTKWYKKTRFKHTNLSWRQQNMIWPPCACAIVIGRGHIGTRKKHVRLPPNIWRIWKMNEHDEVKWCKMRKLFERIIGKILEAPGSGSKLDTPSVVWLMLKRSVHEVWPIIRIL